MPTVRTTLQPDVDLDVPEHEVPVLRHMGVLIEDEPAAEDEKPPTPPTPAVKTTPSTAATPPATTSKES